MPVATHLGLTTPEGQYVTLMVSVKYFLGTFLLPLHPAMDICKTVSNLKQMGTKSRRPITKHNCWWGFNINSIDRMPVIKLTSFSCLANVVRDIIRAGTIHGQEPSLYFCNNQQSVFGCRRDANCFPDTYFVMMNVPETRSSWERIAVSGKYNVVEWCEKEVSSCVLIIPS